MAETAKRARRVRAGTTNGVPRPALDANRGKQSNDDGYDWGVDVAGEISLGGLKLVLANRAGVRIRSPFRLT
jgi:hypothetical protein